MHIPQTIPGCTREDRVNSLDKVCDGELNSFFVFLTPAPRNEQAGFVSTPSAKPFLGECFAMSGRNVEVGVSLVANSQCPVAPGEKLIRTVVTLSTQRISSCC
jgi:hypothetical protein